MTAVDSAKTSLGRRTVLAGAIAAIGLAYGAQAHADSAPVDLQVVDRETGQPLRLWRHDGHLFVAGAPGDRYGLRVTNHTDGRVLVVMWWKPFCMKPRVCRTARDSSLPIVAPSSPSSAPKTAALSSNAKGSSGKALDGAMPDNPAPDTNSSMAPV